MMLPNTKVVQRATELFIDGVTKRARRLGSDYTNMPPEEREALWQKCLDAAADWEHDLSRDNDDHHPTRDLDDDLEREEEEDE